MWDQDERREFLRAEVNVFVNEELEENAKLVRAVDISEAGMRYTKPAGPYERTGQDVFLHFTLPDDEEPIRALGRVVYDELGESTHATSVNFTALSVEDAERIRGYVVRRKRSELFDMLRREHLGETLVH